MQDTTMQGLNVLHPMVGMLLDYQLKMLHLKITYTLQNGLMKILNL